MGPCRFFFLPSSNSHDAPVRLATPPATRGPRHARSAPTAFSGNAQLAFGPTEAEPLRSDLESRYSGECLVFCFSFLMG